MESEDSEWLVAEWTASLPCAFDQDHDCHIGLIGRLYLTIQDTLNGILSILRKLAISKRLYRKLERGYSSLVLWSYSYGVAEGHLDAILANSQSLRNVTISLLVKFCAIILTRKFIRPI